jgi:tetratricopeptide (TPR) repeat protein
VEGRAPVRSAVACELRGKSVFVVLTRLELFLRRANLVLADVAREAGYSRQHFLRLRTGEAEATRGGILAVTTACRKLSRERVGAGMLFERADELLKGPGQRLSRVHLADRRVLDRLLAGPITPEWSEGVVESGVASETAVRHLLRAAGERIDRDPAATAAIYYAAARMGGALPVTAPELAASLQAHALKGRANALRLLGQFEDALTSLGVAAKLFASARYCADEAGQVEYTRAAVLFKMELWDDALAATRAARKRFVQSGDARRKAHAELLEANILFEQGDWDAARATWLRLRKPLAALRDTDALARVWLNLGVCEIRRGQEPEARRWLNRASAAFRAQENDAELARTRWNMATYLATFKSATRALRAFRHAQRAFLGLGMWVDAGCVGLDMTEVMIKLRLPDAVLSEQGRDVASTFVRAGLGVSAAHALDQLRQIAKAADRRRVVRTVRNALRDAEATCSEVAIPELREAEVAPRPPESADA